MTDKTFTLTVVTAGTGDPSSTRILADRITKRVTEVAGKRAKALAVEIVDLREFASEISAAIVSPAIGPKLQRAIDTLAQADGIVACTPVYKAAASGLFMSFFQVLDNDLLIGKPVLLAATAGTARHSLVVDDQLRPLFGYLRALVAPTSLFAAPEDWNDPGLNKRIERAALELVLIMESGFAQQIRDESWDRYTRTEPSFELDSDLMRLAAGGTFSE